MSTNAVVAFLDQHSCNRRAYLGDGVYAGHDGYQIWLVTDRQIDEGPNALHFIALDHHVQAALSRYLAPEPTQPENTSSD